MLMTTNHDGQSALYDTLSRAQNRSSYLFVGTYVPVVQDVPSGPISRTCRVFGKRACLLYCSLGGVHKDEDRSLIIDLDRPRVAVDGIAVAVVAVVVDAAVDVDDVGLDDVDVDVDADAVVDVVVVVVHDEASSTLPLHERTSD